jgi:hypothetical protein
MTGNSKISNTATGGNFGTLGVVNIRIVREIKFSHISDFDQ